MKFKSDIIVDANSYFNGKLQLTIPAVTGRESLLEAYVSDNANDVFIIGNGTTVNGVFIPTFVGYTGGSYQSLLFRGLGAVANDLIATAPYVQYLAANTSSATDPNNGTLTAPANRRLFSWGTVNNDYVTLTAPGNLLIGTTVDNGAALQVNGAATFALGISASNLSGTNTGDQTTISGNAATATTLQTARTIALSGAATGTATSFNGSANITIAVTALNASNLNAGTVPDARISGSYTGMVNLTGSGSVDFSKFLGLLADTVTTPSFTWTGDLTTGIYHPTTSQIAFTTAGVQRALITNTGMSVAGNFAVSATGARLFSIEAVSAGGTEIRLLPNSTGGYATINVGNTNAPLSFQTNSVTRATITQLGSFLINTTVDNGSSLQVNGAATFASNVSLIGVLETKGLNSADPTLGNSSGDVSFLSSDGLYGMYFGSNSSTGDSSIQVKRNDSATAYNLRLNPNGGSILLGQSGSYITSAGAANINSVNVEGILSIGNTTNTKIKWGGNTTPTFSFPFTSATNALFIEVNEGDTGGIVIDNDGVTVYGAADFGYLFRAIDEDVYQGTLNVATATTFQVNQGQNGGGFIKGIWDVSQEIRSPIYYDRDNSAYYLNPESTSNLRNLIVNSSSSTVGFTVNHSGGSGIGAAKFNSAGSSTTYGAFTVSVDSCNYGTGIRIQTNLWGGTSASAMSFYYQASTFVGSISCSSTSTSFNTTSDYRLKENVIKMDSSISRLKELNPCRFNFIIEPNKIVDGFLAHEVQIVIPEAVTGKKDEIRPDGVPEYQAIDQSKIVPLLTSALQEAISEIEKLQSRLLILENK
jgi:hypothetical protein